LNKKQLILGLIVLAALTVLVIWGRNRIHFDFAVFAAQLARASWGRIAAGLACIYLAYFLRSLRWAALMRHSRKVGPLTLLGTQVIGFTAIALIGRVADLVRPFLVARKTGEPLASQMAVYVVERLFDFGSMALIFSSMILFTPGGSIPHPELVRKTGIWGMVGTFAGVLFLIAVRLSGNLIAAAMEKAFGIFSRKLGHAIGNKIRAFNDGLNTIRSFSDFAVTLVYSLAMWILITAAYFITMRAFIASPQLAQITPAQSAVMMLVSGTASSIQLPIIGWFTQIGIVATAITSFFGAEPEAATACAATLLVVTFLGIVPVGLIWSQFENISLRKITAESEHAGSKEETQVEV
jgi:hypothetical protein